MSPSCTLLGVATDEPGVLMMVWWPDETGRLVALCGVSAAVRYGSSEVAPYRAQALQWLAEAPQRVRAG